MTWKISRESGRAANLHDRSAELAASAEPRRSVRLLQADAPAIVLGSTQPRDHVDASRVFSAGVDVVRRRSGGGAVYLAGSTVVWVDIVLPATDPLWQPDVGRAAWWVGESWVRALAGAGLPGGEVWTGAMRRTRWSSMVCFAGVGPGEVLVGSSKVVGVSQRRTRGAALFQTAALVSWQPDRLVDLLRLSPEERAEAASDLQRVARGAGEAAAPMLFDALVAALPA